jgi:drug/metabolite transporter (DMT)-like permease
MLFYLLFGSTITITLKI